MNEAIGTEGYTPQIYHDPLRCQFCGALRPESDSRQREISRFDQADTAMHALLQNPIHAYTDPDEIARLAFACADAFLQRAGT